MSRLARVLMDRAARVTPAAPPLPPTLRPIIPPIDEPELAAVDAPDNIVFFGDSIGLEYRAADGQTSRRRIVIHWVQERGDDYLIHAYCQERRAPRCFRASRVTGIIDLHTGEVVSTAADIRRQFSTLTISGAASPAHATEAALRTLRPGVIILVFMARCDGLEHASERDILLDYLDNVCPPPGVDIAYANHALARLHPEFETFARAVGALARRDQRELHRVARYVRRLIDADGVLSETEATFASEIAQAVR